jgi:syntaxin 16
LFKEFSTLVVEQETLLDRIDYNIDTAAEAIKGGTEILIGVEPTQKRSMVTICLLIFVIALLLTLLVLAVRVTIRFLF